MCRNVLGVTMQATRIINMVKCREFQTVVAIPDFRELYLFNNEGTIQERSNFGDSTLALRTNMDGPRCSSYGMWLRDVLA